MSQDSPQQAPLLKDGQDSRQRVRDARLSSMKLKQAVASIEKEMQEASAIMEGECSAIMEERSMTPWVIAAGVLIFANAIWHPGFLSLAGAALYCWGLHHYRRNWTKEARAAKLKAEGEGKMLALRKALQSRKAELEEAEKSIPESGQT